MYVCVVCILLCAHVRTEGDVRILGYSPTFFTKSGSLSNLDLIEVAGLTCTVPLLKTEITGGQPCPLGIYIYVGSGHLNSGPRTCMASDLTTEPSPRASRQFACNNLMPTSLCVGIRMEGNLGMISRSQRMIELRFKLRYSCAQNLRPFLSNPCWFHWAKYE